MIQLESCQQVSMLGYDYVNHALPRDEHAAVDQHLRNCSSCKVKFQKFQWANGVMAGALDAGSMQPAANFHDTAGQKFAISPRDEDEAFVEIGAGPSFLQKLQRSLGAAPWWMISGAFHALLIMLVTLISFAIIRNDVNDVVIVTDLRKEQKTEEQEERKKDTDVFKKPLPVEQMEVTEETVVVTHEEVEIAEHLETADDSDAMEAFGDEGISDPMLGGSGTVAALGLGGGAGGAYGRPNSPGGRLRRARANGGGKETESAVDKGLEWLARNQEADGHWSARNHGADPRFGDAKMYAADVGMTGFALLAFLGAGHTEKAGKYRDHVRRGVRWLVEKMGDEQKHEGRWCSNNYAQGIAAMALCEAAGMSRLPETMAAAQKCVEGTQFGQIEIDESQMAAWNYRPNVGKTNDSSIMSWNVLALKSAKVAGLRVDTKSFEGAINWINVGQDLGGLKPTDSVGSDWKGGKMAYRGTMEARFDHGREGSHAVMAAAALCRLYIEGAALDSPGVIGPCNIIRDELLPKRYPYNLYFSYYATLAMFQVGGDHWKVWNDAMKKVLLEGQVKGGKEDGSWDPERAACRGGRVMSTALAILCLEVYYRYLPIYR